MVTLDRLEGRKFCVVFVKVMEPSSGKVQLQCLRGRASVDRGRVSVIDDGGCSFTIPGTASQNILPSDGTPLLKDAEYFCLVKVDSSIQLARKLDEGVVEFDDDGCEDHDCEDHDGHDCHDPHCHCHHH